MLSAGLFLCHPAQTANSQCSSRTAANLTNTVQKWKHPAATCVRVPSTPVALPSAHITHMRKLFMRLVVLMPQTITWPQYAPLVPIFNLGNPRCDDGGLFGTEGWHHPALVAGFSVVPTSLSLPRSPGWLRDLPSALFWWHDCTNAENGQFLLCGHQFMLTLRFNSTE